MASAAEIEELLRDGKLTKADKNGRGSSNLFFPSGKSTGFAECTICGRVLKRGGNVTRHAKRHLGIGDGGAFDVDESRTEEGEEVTSAHRDQLQFAVAQYILSVENSEFRELIANVALAANPRLDQSALENCVPGRKGVRSRVDGMAKALMMAAYDEVRPQMKDGMAAVIVDLGTVYEEYMSVFVSFVSTEKFSLRVVPLGLVHNDGGKDHIQIWNLVYRCLSNIGLDEAMVRKCTFVSDGAAAMTKCGEEFFSRNIVCGNHRLHALCKHIEPYKSTESQFTKQELVHLRAMKEAVDRCQAIASLIRRDKKVRNLLPLLPRKLFPAAPVETRWMNVLDTVSDVLSLQHDLFTVKEELSTDLVNYCHAVTAKVEYLHALVACLEPLKEKMLIFQEEHAVTLHRVAPFLRLLNEHYTELENDSSSSEIERILAKSGRIAIGIVMGKTITDVHLAAMLLSPQHKGFRRFTALEKDTAMDLVRKMLDEVPQAPKTSASPVKKKKKLLEDDEDEPATDELTTYCLIPASKMSVEEFWRTNQQTFPRLSIVAQKIFGILPSEAACERHFSLVGRLVTKYRTSLCPEVVERIVLGAQLSKVYRFE